MRLLLIEDDPDHARLLGHHLRGLGEPVEVIWRQTLHEGLDSLADAEWDVALLDLGLPGSHLDRTLGDALAVNARDVPIVVMSAIGRDVAATSLAQGARACLDKASLTRESVAIAIETALGPKDRPARTG